MKNKQWKVLALSRRRNKHRIRRNIINSDARKIRAYRAQRACIVAPQKFHKKLGMRVRSISAPPVLNLSSAYEGTMLFLRKLREVAESFDGRVMLDLQPLREITPAGALMLVAECDRWRELVPGGRLRTVDPEAWDPSVRRRLAEMGFFTLLQADSPVVDEDNIPSNGDVYVSFIAGHDSEGEAARSLRQSIDSLGARVRDPGALYDGLVEAMTNVKHHAYSQSAGVKRWWMSACVNLSNRRLTVVFVDHGSGIPATLPRSEIWEDVRGFLGRLGLPVKDDARLIEAAVSVERTRTGEGHRGNGLRRDIQGYVEDHDARGRLRIISGRGEYVYEKRKDFTPTKHTRGMPISMGGTFLEWVIEDYDSTTDEND